GASHLLAAFGGRAAGFDPGVLGLGLGKGLQDVSRVVQLDQLGRGLDDLGLGDPLGPRLVVDAAAASERAVRRDGEVVRVLVDEHDAAELADARLVRAHESFQLFAGPCQEIRALQLCVPGHVGQEGVVSTFHVRPPYRWTLSSGPIRSRRNIEWWRSMIHSDPRWAIAWIPSSCSSWSRTA